jgi:dihydrofolate synthase/folylpolyglutamate synthase
MTYDEALAFWFARTNYERITPNLSDLKLDRMRDLLAVFGNPEEKLRIVHVAGSKGKGSTSAMLAAVFQAAGYRTGLFTSPHLCHVAERVQVNGQPIAHAELAGILTEIAHILEAARRENYSPELAMEPTFFEIATAVGFLYFARQAVDVAVVEVGLGGRFDSTNVCLPLVSLITSISHDHVQQLGTRLESISMEKAGIIKPGRPAISGARVPEARSVIEDTCRARGAPLRQLGQDFHYRYRPGFVGRGRGGAEPKRSHVDVLTERRTWPDLELGLLGEHQAANAAVAVACIEEVNSLGLRVEEEAVRRGLADVQWPARLEVFGPGPLTVLDCAHNIASAQALVDALLTSFARTRRHLVFAVSSDKDLSGILRILAPHFERAYFTLYNSPRSASPSDLASIAETCGLPATVCESPRQAWQTALASAHQDDLICVTGSVFLAGELRPVLLSINHGSHG